MTRTYIAQIDSKIERLQDQIDDLMLAKRIIMALRDEDERPKGTGTTELAIPKALPKPVQHERGTRVLKMFSAKIHEILMGIAEPVTSAIVIQELRAQGVDVPKKQRVWAALADMKRRGVVTHDKDTGTYILSHKVKHNEDAA